MKLLDDDSNELMMKQELEKMGYYIDKNFIPKSDNSSIISKSTDNIPSGKKLVKE